MDKIKEAQRVFDVEIEALEKTKNAIDDTFVNILDMITNCEGKVIITGMGKPGHIARKLAATMASLGTPAFCLHPAEALHGDLGMVTDRDIVIAISYSGESEEITRILPNIKLIGAKIIAFSGNSKSTLVKYSDIAQIFPDFDEACYLKLAPTSSTTATLVYGDALAVVASGVYGFDEKKFGVYHPAGALGKKLITRVQDIMAKEEINAVISINESLKNAIVEISKKGLGIVNIIDKSQCLQGVVTDGDIRRLLEKGVDVYTQNVKDVMTDNPITLREDDMAIEALKILKDKSINCAPVLDKQGKIIGTVTISMILKAGIVL